MQAFTVIKENLDFPNAVRLMQSDKTLTFVIRRKHWLHDRYITVDRHGFLVDEDHNELPFRYKDVCAHDWELVK